MFKYVKTDDSIKTGVGNFFLVFKPLNSDLILFENRICKLLTFYGRFKVLNMMPV